MHGPLRLTYALLANYLAKCQMSSGPYGPIFNHKTLEKYYFCSLFIGLQIIFACFQNRSMCSINNNYYYGKVLKRVKAFLLPILIDSNSETL